MPIDSCRYCRSPVLKTVMPRFFSKLWGLTNSSISFSVKIVSLDSSVIANIINVVTEFEKSNCTESLREPWPWSPYCLQVPSTEFRLFAILLANSHILVLYTTLIFLYIGFFSVPVLPLISLTSYKSSILAFLNWSTLFWRSTYAYRDHPQ